ncbi:MAG: sigma-E processing peptidase SpoIIGA [Halanaerobiaceae bacterium]
MIIYIDIIFVTNTLLTSALLFAVGNLLDLNYRWWRIVAAACLGTLYTFLVLFLQYNLPPGRILIILQVILNLATAVLMIVISFGSLPVFMYMKAVGYLYVLSFFAVGTGISVFYLYGANPFQSRNLLFLLLVLTVIVLSGKFGLLLIKKYINSEQGICRLIIEIEEKRVVTEGLIDTGNRLQDPFTGMPVIIVEVRELLRFFEGELGGKLRNWKGDVYDLMKYLERNETWRKRIRAVPFSDLGQESGLLVGIKPDCVKVEKGEGDYYDTGAVLGITERRLDNEGQYSALINPDIISKGGGM